MDAFDVGMMDGMEKTAGVGSWIKGQGKSLATGFRGLGTMAASPREAYGALKQSLKTQGLRGTLKGSKHELKALGATAAGVGALGGAGYMAGRRRNKTAAASNPAQAVKSSMGTGAPEAQRFAPYLNMGGGQAPMHQAGAVEGRPQPWPGHVNIGDKGAGQQVAGPVAMDKSPDTGERGSSGGDMVVTKSAAFAAGIDAVLNAHDE